jgi:Rieske Fe-S protein
MKHHRRRFIKVLLTAAAGLIAWPARMIGAKKLAVSLDKAEKLKKTGGSTILKIKDREVLFIRETAERIRALSPACTHNKCLVGYNREKNRIDCPCHGSRFDLEGRVLKGPAKEPLATYPAYLDDQGRVIVSLDDA